MSVEYTYKDYLQAVVCVRKGVCKGTVIQTTKKLNSQTALLKVLQKYATFSNINLNIMSLFYVSEPNKIFFLYIIYTHFLKKQRKSL